MGTPTDSSSELAAMVANDPALQERVKQDPVATLQSLSEPVSGDKWVYRMVVIALGLTALFVVIGVFTLKALDNNTTIPDALVAVSSAAIAALAALLAPSHPHGDKQPCATTKVAYGPERRCSPRCSGSFALAGSRTRKD
jgi:hypothetical protein